MAQKRKTTGKGGTDSLMVALALEKSKMNREKSLILLDKGMLLYFSFLFVAVLGFVNNYLTVGTLNVLVLMSFGVLVVAIAPYLVVMRREEKQLTTLLEGLHGGNRHG